WVLKLDRGGAVHWQNTYLAPGPRLSAFGGAAFAVEARTGGGYRVAGRLDIYREAGSRESGSLAFFDELGWVSDLNDDGTIDVNAKSGMTIVPTTATPTDVTAALALVR